MKEACVFFMQVEVGAIVEGKVTGLTNFGAFVSLPDGKTGMVHISEVAPTYVKEIRDYLTENQEVKVKVLSVGDDGRVSLSIKRAMERSSSVPLSGSSGRVAGISAVLPRRCGRALSLCRRKTSL